VLYHIILSDVEKPRGHQVLSVQCRIMRTDRPPLPEFYQLFHDHAVEWEQSGRHYQYSVKYSTVQTSINVLSSTNAPDKDIFSDYTGI